MTWVNVHSCVCLCVYVKREREREREREGEGEGEREGGVKCCSVGAVRHMQAKPHASRHGRITHRRVTIAPLTFTSSALGLRT